MSEKSPDTVAADPGSTGLVGLLDALARFQSAALLYPPTHRRIAESSGALVEALRQASDIKGEVRLALDDGRLLRDGKLVSDLSGPAKKLVGEWDALGIAKLAFLPQIAPEDLIAFARFLKEASTQSAGGRRPTLASFELVPASIDIVSRDFGRPHRSEESRPRDSIDMDREGGDGEGGNGEGGGTGDGIGAGSGGARIPARPIDDEERAIREWTAQRDAPMPEMTLPELVARLHVDEMKIGIDAAAAAQDDRVATVAWLVHMLSRPTHLAVGRAGIEGRLAVLIAERCSEREQAVLVAALSSLAQADAAKEFAAVFDALAPALRSVGAERAALLLLPLHERCGDAVRRVIWLRLAQELLLSLGPRGDEAEHRVVAILAAVGAEFDETAGELAALPVVRDKRFARNAFAPARRELYGLYRALVRVGGAADEIVMAFLERPPVTPAAAAFFALRDDPAEARRFLERYLASAARSKEDAALCQHAATILRSFLETLMPGERGGSTVVSAVAGLARLSSSGRDTTLLRIRGERRWLLFPAWPKECRTAAARGAVR